MKYVGNVYLFGFSEMSLNSEDDIRVTQLFKVDFCYYDTPFKRVWIKDRFGIFVK